MKDRDTYDNQLTYAKWVNRLNKMDYQRATRSFYAQLGSKNRAPEYLGSIKKDNGDLCTNLHDCLETWASFYSKLYSRKRHFRGLKLMPDLRNPTLAHKQTSQLNTDISLSDIILAINSLKDYCTPGNDMILNRDFTILLHMEPGKNAVIILNRGQFYSS